MSDVDLVIRSVGRTAAFVERELGRNELSFERLSARGKPIVYRVADAPGGRRLFDVAISGFPRTTLCRISEPDAPVGAEYSHVHGDRPGEQLFADALRREAGRWPKPTPGIEELEEALGELLGAAGDEAAATLATVLDLHVTGGDARRALLAALAEAAPASPSRRF